MSNTKPKLIDSVKEHALETLDDIYSSNRKDASYHKSFDFSNVAIFAENDDYTEGAQDDAYFRRFHQMSLFIDIPNKLYHHTEKNSGGTALITSNLPEQISYSIGSIWSTPLSFGSGATNLIMQMGGKAIDENWTSGVSRATTMRIWDGAKPLSLNLKIPVIDDGKDGSNTNLVEALEFLGSLALPRRGKNSLYIPPPSPLNATISYMTDFDEKTGKPIGQKDMTLNTTYGRIILQLGGILLVDHCILEGFDVHYPNTKTMIRHDYTSVEGESFGKTGAEYLHPLLAEVTLKISTVEAMTDDFYSKMLWAKSNKMGQGSLDLSTGMMGYISAISCKAGKTMAESVYGLKSKVIEEGA